VAVTVFNLPLQSATPAALDTVPQAFLGAWVFSSPTQVRRPRRVLRNRGG